MAIILGSTGITFPDATTQTTAAVAATGTLIGYRVYTTVGTNTYTKATNNPSFIIVELVGGGGGSICGSPTGAGTGGTTSFGTLCTATGGQGGIVGTATRTGGTGTLGDLNIQGGYGSSSSANAKGDFVNTWGGSPALYGASNGSRYTIGSTSGSVSNLAGKNYGCGAGASASGSGGGTAGSGAGGGYARKKILASALAASETVTVGAGGTAGSNGLVGGQGLAIVWEYK